MLEKKKGAFVELIDIRTQTVRSLVNRERKVICIKVFREKELYA